MVASQEHVGNRRILSKLKRRCIGTTHVQALVSVRRHGQAFWMVMCVDGMELCQKKELMHVGSMYQG